MVWINRSHAGPLSVLFVWLTALVPWNVTYSPLGGAGRVLFVRFPFVELQYTTGVGPTVDGLLVRTVLGAMGLQAGQGLETATRLWGLTAVVVAVAVAVSVAYYLDEERVEAGPADPVRLLGGLLALAAVGFAAATAAVWTGGFGGVPIPVGVVLIGSFAFVLLRAEVSEDIGRDADSQ